MEEKSMKKLLKNKFLLEVIYIAFLVVPLLGILRNYDQSLAEIELGDPVLLTFSYPDFMELFKWALYAALFCSILPLTRKFYGMLLGFCLGGLMFLYQSTMADLRSLSEMGLSQTPLEEMIELTKQGENFAFWCIAAAICFLIVMLAECVQSLFRKKSGTSSTLD
ncbi:MAG: hypothetical protein ACI9E1_002038 [Cryomorphaceae bacterium]